MLDITAMFLRMVLLLTSLALPTKRRPKLTLLLKIKEQKLNDLFQLLASNVFAIDIELVQNKDFEFDDDNMLSHKNIPTINQIQNKNNLNEVQSRKSDCIDQQTITGVVNQSLK